MSRALHLLRTLLTLFAGVACGIALVAPAHAGAFARPALSAAQTSGDASLLAALRADYRQLVRHNRAVDDITPPRSVIERLLERFNRDENRADALNRLRRIGRRTERGFRTLRAHAIDALQQLEAFETETPEGAHLRKCAIRSYRDVRDGALAGIRAYQAVARARGSGYRKNIQRANAINRGVKRLRRCTKSTTPPDDRPPRKVTITAFSTSKQVEPPADAVAPGGTLSGCDRTSPLAVHYAFSNFGVGDSMTASWSLDGAPLAQRSTDPVESPSAHGFEAIESTDPQTGARKALPNGTYRVQFEFDGKLIAAGSVQRECAG